MPLPNIPNQSTTAFDLPDIPDQETTNTELPDKIFEFVKIVDVTRYGFHVSASLRTVGQDDSPQNGQSTNKHTGKLIFDYGKDFRLNSGATGTGTSSNIY
jgi:hypothetical protein